MLRATYLATLLAMPISAMAAPYCLQNQALPPQCIYDDPGDCARNATKQGGTCSVNSKETTLRTGFGNYCVVSSNGAANCFYHDRQTCTTAAQQAHGMCTEAPAAPGAPTPFVADPNANPNGL